MEYIYMMLLIISSLIIGLIASIIAKRKRGDPFVWFWIGVITNIFVILIWSLYQKKKGGSNGR